MSKVAIVLLAIAAVAFAQIPARCRTPDEFEGRLSRWDHGKGEHFVGAFFYDGANQRFAMMEEQQVGKTGRSPHGFIYLHNVNLMYDIDFRMQKCQTKPIPPTEAWRAWGIPDNATFSTEYTEGVVGEGFMVSEWTMNTWVHPQGWMWVGSFTLNQCVPIQEVVFTNVSDSISTHYYDITLGLSDPTVFIPPSYCK